MTKTHYIETTETFNESGKLVERVTREEWTEDNTVYDQSYTHHTTPISNYCDDSTHKAASCVTEVKC